MVVKLCVEQKGGKLTKIVKMVMRCIIHQQVLCGKNINLSCIIEPVVSIINSICSHGPDHQFHKFVRTRG